MTTSDIELKRNRVEKLVGGLLLLVAGFIVAPFIYIAIKGLVGLGLAAAIIVASYYLSPAVGRWLGNLRVKALKAVAAADPIATLQNIYAEKKDVLVKKRDQIKQLIAVGAKMYEQITGFETKFNKPSPRRTGYEQLQTLITITKNKYSQAQQGLVQFGQFIEEKQADWEIACSMAEANKLAKVGEDFTTKLMQDTAFGTIQDGLNIAFAEVDAAVMDENIQKVLAGQTIEIAPAVVGTTKAKALSAPSRNDLDLDFETVEEREPVLVSARSARK